LKRLKKRGPRRQSHGYEQSRQLSGRSWSLA
jgi:hypothetical protein